MTELLKASPNAVARIMTADEKRNYHDRDDVSQSGLKVSMKDPQKYWRQFVKKPRDPRDPPTASMKFGNDCEDFLFNNRVPRDAKLIPERALNSQGHKRNDAGQTNWTDWLEETGYDPSKQLLLKQDEWDDHLGPLAKVRENVMAHKRARTLLFDKPNERHIGIFGVDEPTGMGTRGELDNFSSINFIFDLKSTKETRLAGFEKEIWTFGYHIQAYWYQRLVYQLTGEVFPFVFIVVGNRGGHYVETYDLHDDWLQLARPVVRRGLDRLAEMYRTGKWVTRTHGSLHTAKPKPWMHQQVWEDET